MTRPPGKAAGTGLRFGWRIRKLQLFASCCVCKHLIKKGERCYVLPRDSSPDTYSCLEHGNPDEWDFYRDRGGIRE